MRNLELRQFQDELNDLVNSHPELPWEARLLAIQLTASEVHKLADKAIIAEMEEEKCKKPITE